MNDKETATESKFIPRQSLILLFMLFQPPEEAGQLQERR